MLRHRRATFSGVLGLAVLTFAASTLAATTRVVVTPTNMQGWTATHAPAPTVTFNGPSDSDGGNGSLRVGPIAAPNSMKLELQPPETNFLVSDFDSASLEYRIITPVAGNSANHIYMNVYVDDAANGIGTFTNGFYDCRHSFVASANAAGWNSMSFNDSTVPTAQGGSLCSATLSAATAGSKVIFFRLNVGDTSGNDNGLEAAVDLVEIVIAGNGKLYDFEPYAVASAKEQCKDGGWQGVFRANGSAFKNQGDCIQYVNTGK